MRDRREQLKRHLANDCPAGSNECAIRGMCTNKCGALDDAQSTVAHRYALTTVVTRVAQSCARPIEVGDYVRWTSPMDSRAWADGVITRRYPSAAMGSLGKDAAFDVKLAAVGDWTGRDNHPEVGETVTVACHALRRIPRPAEAQATVPPPAPVLVDPLDVEYDGVRLRDLLVHDERQRQEDHAWDEFAYGQLTPAQRAAVSAHWSAALRAKVAAGPSLDGSTYGERIAKERRERDRARVRVDRQDEP